MSLKLFIKPSSIAVFVLIVVSGLMIASWSSTPPPTQSVPPLVPLLGGGIKNNNNSSEEQQKTSGSHPLTAIPSPAQRLHSPPQQQQQQQEEVHVNVLLLNKMLELDAKVSRMLDSISAANRVGDNTTSRAVGSGAPPPPHAPSATTKAPQTPVAAPTTAPTTTAVPRLYRAAQYLNLTIRLVNESAVAHEPSRSVKPRIAVCFFGLVKNLDDQRAIDYANNIFRPLRAAGFIIDAFMHTYVLGNKAYSNKRNREAATVLNQSESIAKITSSSILPELTHIDISEPAEADSTMPDLAEVLRHGNPWTEDGNVSMKYYLRQLYSLMKVTEMWSNISLVSSPRSRDLFGRGEENISRAAGTGREVAEFAVTPQLASFDCVIYLRPDLAIPIRLNMRAVHRLCSPFSPHRPLPLDVALPRFEFGGYHDRFAFGTPAGMFLYGARGLMLHRYLQLRLGPAHAETFLKVLLCDNEVPVHLVPMYAQRVRAQGHVGDGGVRQLRNHYFRGIVQSWSEWYLHSLENDPGTGKYHSCAPVSVWGEP